MSTRNQVLKSRMIVTGVGYCMVYIHPATGAMWFNSKMPDRIAQMPEGRDEREYYEEVLRYGKEHNIGEHQQHIYGQVLASLGGL